MGRGVEFPESTRFGVAQSGFQFEMGDRYHRYIDPNSDWWAWARDPGNIAARILSGDLPEDGPAYLEMYRVDHENARKLGLDIWWIGVEWSRIFPHPTWFVEVDVEHDANGLIRDVRITDEILRQLDRIADHDSISMYRSILIDMRSHGIKPIVCVNHYTMPRWLHNPIKARDTNLEEGPLGLLENTYPVEFAKFAAYLAWRLGDLVDLWYVFNEPMVPIAGYISPYTGFPPGVQALDKIPKLITNTVLSHALAYNMIKRFDNIKVDQDSREAAEVGMVYNFATVYPLNPGDEEAAENLSYFYNDIIMNAVVHGKLDIGLNRKDLIEPALLGTKKLDWIGVNYYTRSVVRKVETGAYGVQNFEFVPGYGYDCTPNGVSKAGRWCADNGWEFYPEGLVRAVEIGEKYSDNIYITENGVADSRDIYRPQLIVNMLYVLHELLERGAPVKGYMHWALVDNYEWAQGFRMRFGLYEVDYSTKQRTLRRSGRIYGEIASSKRISADYVDKYLIQMERH